MLIAYTKNVNVAEIIGTDLPDDPALVEDLVNYFPTPLRERYRTEILRHRLRREIAITQLMNQMVNLSGISYDHRMTEDTGASVGDVARAWVTVREVLDFPELVGGGRRTRGPQARRPPRHVPRLPAHRRAMFVVVPAQPSPAGEHRRRGREFPGSDPGTARTQLRSCLRARWRVPRPTC